MRSDWPIQHSGEEALQRFRVPCSALDAHCTGSERSAVQSAECDSALKAKDSDSGGADLFPLHSTTHSTFLSTRRSRAVVHSLIGEYSEGAV